MKRMILVSAMEALSMEMLRQHRRDQLHGTITTSNLSMSISSYDEPAPSLDFGPRAIACRACGKHDVGTRHRCPVVRLAERERQKKHATPSGSRRR